MSAKSKSSSKSSAKSQVPSSTRSSSSKKELNLQDYQVSFCYASLKYLFGVYRYVKRLERERLEKSKRVISGSQELVVSYLQESTKSQACL
jgi:hypothetical protein